MSQFINCIQKFESIDEEKAGVLEVADASQKGKDGTRSPTTLWKKFLHI